MTKNAKVFNSFLASKEVKPDVNETEDDTRFTLHYNLKGGPNVRIVCIFDEDDTMVRLYFFDYINSVDESKKAKIYEVINKINLEYTYVKFVIDDDNDVYASYFVTVNNNFDSQIIFNLMLTISEIMEEKYPAFMKVVWA